MTRREEDFAREIAAHLEVETDRLIAEGLPADRARAAARRHFGSPTRATERFYESRRALWLDHLRQDFRSALRSMARTPIACAVAVLSLAGGIGATTATLMIRRAVFHNPPPLYQRPDQLSRVGVSTPAQPRARVPAPMVARWAADPELGSGLGGALPPRGVDFRAADRVERLRVRPVTPGFFEVLGVAPAIGRSLPTSPERDAPRVVVLGHRVWQDLFAGGADVVGTGVWLDGEPYTVVGVMPARFWFDTTDSEIWTPFAPAAFEGHDIDVVIRRPEGLSSAALADRLQRVVTDHAGLASAEPRQMRVLVTGIAGSDLAREMSAAIPWFVGAAVLLTLLIACVNVAILLFARWTAREREMAVRSCLGASRRRTIALLLTESVTLAMCGGVLGFAATLALLRTYLRNAPGISLYDMSIDPGIFLQAALVTLLTGIAAGIAPALFETRRLQTTPLRLIVPPDRVRQRWRHALVVLEVAVTVALMVVAAGQVDASRRMLGADRGYDAASLISARVENAAGIDVRRVLDVVRRLLGVAAAAAATAVPMAATGTTAEVTVGAGGPVLAIECVGIGSDYFRTLDVRLLAGRGFDDRDSGSSRTVVVNEVLARRLWPGRDPVGTPLLIANERYDVVGVVAGYASGPTPTPSPRVYRPLVQGQRLPTGMPIVVRAAADVRSVVKRLREEMRGLGRGYRVPFVFSVKEVLNAGAAEIMVLAVATSPLLAIGLFLTASGVFAVLASAISRRGRELAVRAALGAGRGALARLVIAQTLSLMARGALAGVFGTYLLTRAAAAAGDGGSSLATPRWEAFALPVAIVLAVAAMAAWIPARRAMHADPARLLRSE